jgi:hypothetical protein
MFARDLFGVPPLLSKSLRHAVVAHEVGKFWVAVVFKEVSEYRVVISAHFTPKHSCGILDAELAIIDTYIRKVKKEYRGATIMLCSDSNAQLPQQYFMPCLSGPLSEAQISEKGASLLAFMHEHSLVAHNTFENTGFGRSHTCLDDSWTWEDARGESRVILDHVIRNGRVLEWAVDFEADVNTDHNAIVFTLPCRLPGAGKRRRRKPFSRKGWQPVDTSEEARYKSIVFSPKA